MLLVTVAAGAAPPDTKPQNLVPLYPVQNTPPVPGVPPPLQPPPPLSSYANPSGAGFPGPLSVSGPAILVPPQSPYHA